jgi:hypothetical protein
VVEPAPGSIVALNGSIFGRVIAGRDNRNTWQKVGSLGTYRWVELAQQGYPIEVAILPGSLHEFYGVGICYSCGNESQHWSHEEVI